MEESPKISIVVPIYKVENYLERCIKSILNQSYKNLEIILVDDGSPDLCGKICDDYKIKESRISVIHQVNRGLSEARNAGIDVATGKYIAFIDSDDYIQECMIETLYKNLVRHDAQISCCGHIDVYEGSNVVQPNRANELFVLSAEEALSKFLFTQVVDVVAWNKLYDIQLFNDIHYLPGKLFEDHFTTYKLLDKANTIVYFSKPMYFYCKRSTSIGGNSFSERTFELKEALVEECNYIKKKYPKIKKQIELGYLTWIFVVYDKMILAQKNDPVFLNEIRKLTLRSLPQIIVSRDITKSKKMQLMLLLINKDLYFKIYCWYLKKYR